MSAWAQRADSSAAPDAAPQPPGGGRVTVADVTTIWGSRRLGDLLVKAVGGCEQPCTVWEASAACSELDSDLCAAHSLLRALYGRRFPELEAIVRAGPTYAAVARRLGCGGGGGYGGVAFGGGLGGGAVASALAPLLPPASVMVVSLAAATTRGRSLTEYEQECVTEVLDAEAGMTAARAVLGAYVEARMAAAAPELAALLGAEAAARLVAAAGGLSALARTPACNVPALARAAAAAAAAKPGAGPGAEPGPGAGPGAGPAAAAGGLLACPTLLAAPLHLRRKVARLLAAKAVLAARVDASRLPPPGAASYKIHNLNNNNAHQRNNNNTAGGAPTENGKLGSFVPGQAGTALRQQVERRLRQLQAPPPPKETRALARPPPGVGLLGGSVGGGAGHYVGGGAGRRRGGRRARRQRRQRGQLTVLQRLRARVRLADVWTGAAPEADGCWGWGGGGGGGGGGAVGPGGVRAPPPDDRTKVRISRALQRRLAVERERCLALAAATPTAMATPTAATPTATPTTATPTAATPTAAPGTASSVAFSAVGGLEIVHPAAAAAQSLPGGRGRYFTDIGAC